MKLDKFITKKGLLFLVIFSILVFIADKINFSKLFGAENQFFTLFQFFGPIAGAFLGPFVGVLSVLIAEIASKIVNHAAWNWVTALRLLPMLFAAWYFGTKKEKISLFVPIAAIILFVAHPVGRQVWYFSLFWTIPLILEFAPQKYSKYAVSSIVGLMGIIMMLTSTAFREAWFMLALLAAVALSYQFSALSSKSLGATFTAHAVGGAMWNYITPMTPAAWMALIPIVIFERLLFSGGIAILYVSMNNLLEFTDNLLQKLKLKSITGYINIDKRYLLFKQSA